MCVIDKGMNQRVDGWPLCIEVDETVRQVVYHLLIRHGRAGTQLQYRIQMDTRESHARDCSQVRTTSLDAEDANGPPPKISLFYFRRGVSTCPVCNGRILTEYV